MFEYVCLYGAATQLDQPVCLTDVRMLLCRRC